MIVKLRSLKRGFTLVELMIVVAIVGILAALAVYGVAKYVKSAKTAEARDALGRMGKDAVTVYNREGMDPAVMDLGATVGISHRLCSTAVAVPKAAVPKAQKYQSTPGDWDSPAGSDQWTGWSCLKFSMNEPQYFQYDYQAADPTGATGTFTCLAHGDLDGNGTTSDYSIGGAVKTDATSKKTTAVLAPNLAEKNGDE